MKITICGSMSASKEMIEAKEKLETMGHEVIVPKNTDQFAEGKTRDEDKWEKIEHDVIRGYFEEIKNSDAILVVNVDKSDIKDYIGGNSLIEIAFAHVSKKKIFLLNPVPEISYTNEIEAMQPIILNGDLSQIK